ncbi:MAG: hypothetical protein CVV49_16915 [Spirochaetae bacterium HGW-Spirochaetae-5]|nr:MAG: hypothetical protein CVV49_16915 [Spirochaetae bacterium HGW-Spirochaetae-5]
MEKTRHYYLDWLRVTGMGIIFFFHNARFFDYEGWHIKNTELTFGATVFIGITSQFIMPLFFLLSAYAIYYALQHRSKKDFARERVIRILIPLIFGIFTIIPPQVYIERVTHGEFTGSFFQFIPEYFNGWYAFGGNFAWMGLHLWYLLILFIFSILALPLFGRIGKSRLTGLLSAKYAVYLLFIPIALMELLVNTSPDGIGIRGFGGWSPLTYFIIFITGYILAADDRFRHEIIRIRFISLLLALSATSLGYYFAVQLNIPDRAPAFAILRGFNTWCWLLTFVGMGAKYLDFNNRFLEYSNEAVLPFYILHQSVIVITCFFLLNLIVTPIVKYLIISIISFAVIMLLYEFAVKRFSFLRKMFGMKPA